MTVETHWSETWLGHRGLGRGVRRAREPGTRHNEARDQILDELGRDSDG